MEEKLSIYGLDLADLEKYFISIGENPAKGKMLMKALYQRQDFSTLKDFSHLEIFKNSLLKRLSADFSLELPTLVENSQSDTAAKGLFALQDGKFIEAVLMKQKYGNSICVSTQIGCNMGCAFCESGKHKKERNLTAAEMVSQLLYMKEKFQSPIQTVAVMGIGEPLDNFDELMKFLAIITDDNGMAIGIRHITVSTCGIIPKIDQLASHKPAYPLALSLHSADDQLRSQLMPINKTYNLELLKSSLLDYCAKSKRKVFLEYVMLENVNDSLNDAQKLVEFCTDLKCTVNLIAYNETNSMGFKATKFEDIMTFYDYLKKNGVHATIRREFGAGIDAACGQLKSKHLKKNT